MDYKVKPRKSAIFFVDSFCKHNYYTTYCYSRVSEMSLCRIKSEIKNLEKTTNYNNNIKRNYDNLDDLYTN